MPIELITEGDAFTICAWMEDNGDCPTIDFLEELHSNGDKDSDRIKSLMERTANHGIIKNPEMNKALGDGIYELKGGKARVLYFFDKDKLIICTHGFKKKTQKTPPAEIERAKRIRTQYFNE